MSKNIKQTLQEEYNRLKDRIEKLVKPKKQQPVPQLVLQPYRNKKRF